MDYRAILETMTTKLNKNSDNRVLPSNQSIRGYVRIPFLSKVNSAFHFVEQIIKRNITGYRLPIYWEKDFHQLCRDDRKTRKTIADKK